MSIRPRTDLHPDAYRALVEGAPAILYIDRPDELSTNLYTSPHLGLSTISERAELAGGWCRVESEPRLGTVVRCWMPLDAGPGRYA